MQRMHVRSVSAERKETNRVLRKRVAAARELEEQKKKRTTTEPDNENSKKRRASKQDSKATSTSTTPQGEPDLDDRYGQRNVYPHIYAHTGV